MFELLFGSKYKEFLGINRRNQEYLRPSNPDSAKRIADNKLTTKRVLVKLNIKTPETYKVIRTKKQLQYLDWESLPKSFVLKPNRGTYGNGILIFYGRDKRELSWIRPNGKRMGKRDLILHMENVLEGRYSMGGKRDVVIIEERLNNDLFLKKFSYKGVPDIRVISYNQVPVMAMLRLPTKKSDGKANLHAGGIAAGIDIASGLTTSAVIKKSSLLLDYDFDVIDSTVDLNVNQPLSGIKIPYWDEILNMTLRAQNATGLGFIGVDIAIDRDKGPMIFEVNARPGLGVQIANQAGLRSRLERVDGLKIKGVKHGIRVAKNLFGGEIEEEIELMSGKKVVNLVEKVYVYHRNQTKTRKKKMVKASSKRELVNAMLDTGITTTRIDRGLASRIGYNKDLKYFFSNDIPKSFDSFEEAQVYINESGPKLIEGTDLLRVAMILEDGHIIVRPVLKISIKIASSIKEIEAIISSQSAMIYPLLIGRKELKNYLIDASKTFSK
jgi:alpha-L-glutamate ligase-like protein